jgi:rare lipoprotein A
MRRVSVANAVLAVVLGLLTIAGDSCAARSRNTAVAATPGTRDVLLRNVGLASYYGPGFQGNATASGVVFDQQQLVAAHPTFPFGTIVRVRCLDTGRSVIVRIVDRGPAEAMRAEGVLIDLSKGAAERLRMIKEGRARVALEVLKWGTNRIAH